MEFGTSGKEPVFADGAESDVVFFRLDDALDGFFFFFFFFFFFVLKRHLLILSYQ